MKQTNAPTEDPGDAAERQRRAIQKLLAITLDRVSGNGGARGIAEYERGVRDQYRWMVGELERLRDEQRRWRPDSPQHAKCAAACERQEKANDLVQNFILPKICERREVESRKWNANAGLVNALRDHLAADLKDWGLTDALA